jgi:hypothetical protein
MGDSTTQLYVTRAEKDTIQPCQDFGESVDDKRQCSKCFGHLCPETCGVWARTHSVCTACYSAPSHDIGTPYPCSRILAPYFCPQSSTPCRDPLIFVAQYNLLFDSQRTKIRRLLLTAPHLQKALPLFMVPLPPTHSHSPPLPSIHPLLF